ncbi:E3 ubiquitin-protein ligase TRAIP-like [Bradysia coprophila]|uniref:E3 ubiquitin-protein ligase TRAIP-like n=1 Tax=Bradysia coprophila TaxID=38358 RepID=UPI00187DA89E|nr:E3 ubiquitin-protein ligase TRAIP-like [Bradysia coprophila]
MAIQCTICMASLSFTEAANAASCGHVFHEPCLVRWFRQSKTCPQCRARCDERQVRRLYFSAELNSSSVDVDSLQLDLDNAQLEVNNLRSNLDAKKTEITKLRDKHKETKSTILGLDAQLELTRVQLQNANSQIASQKSELNRLRAVEAGLNVKMQEAKDLEYIKSIIDSSVSLEVEEILQGQSDVKVLATLVSTCKRELVKVKRSRDEAQNNRRNCQEENAKLVNVIRQLTEKINTLESDNYKLQDDLSQLKRSNDLNTTANEAAASAPATTIHSSQPASRSIQLSTSTTPRTGSPYLSIRQSNVGLTPLLHRKRKAEAEAPHGAFRNLTIFNNPRKLSRPVSGAQPSGTIYNGFGGSERKENFAGFPNGTTRKNSAGSG